MFIVLGYDILTGRRRPETSIGASDQMAGYADRDQGDNYAALFEGAPVAIWDEDFSAVHAFITEIQRGTNDLREHFNSHPESLDECIRRVRVLHVNKRARQFYGASSEEDLRWRLPDLIDQGTRGLFRDELVAFASGRATFEAEFAARTLAGEERIVHMNATMLPTSRPWSRVIVAFTDLTERRKLERDLLQSQKLESLGRLAGGVAHDLNNALTIINGYSDMSLSELPPEHSVHAHLEEIRKAGERAAGLIRHLLAFSRKQVLQPKVLNLNGVIREAQKVLRAATGEHILIHFALAPDLCETRVDPSQIYHVLLNLVLNARDAMPEGGVLEIRTENVTQRGGSPGLLPGRYVAMHVKDTGVGIDETTLPRVFEPFFTTKELGKGTGLGLSSSFGIVQQSGGSILVKTAAGQGSTFSVYLPCADLDEPIPMDREPGIADLNGSETILLVEDDREVRGLLLETLRRHGYAVIGCSHPAEAIRVFEDGRAPVQLLVTDVVMPGMTGPQLASRLRQKTPGLKVVYISGYGNDTEGWTESLGRTAAFLQKPFGPDDLASEVRQLLATV